MRQAPGAAQRRAVAVPRINAASLVYGAAALYALVFAAAAAIRHLTFGSGRLDLGNMVQAVWSTSNGRLLEVTDLGGAQISRLGAHVDPFLALLAPVWLLVPSPLVLLLLQAGAVASGALPVFWLARKRLSSSTVAGLFALAYLAYPAVQWNAFTPMTGFHPVSFAIPLAAFAVWFLETGRLGRFAVAAALAASTKEHMALAVGMLGIWYAVEHRQRLAGIAIAAAGTIVAVVNFLVVIPSFAAEGGHPLSFRYEQFGSSPTEIFLGVLRQPIEAISVATEPHKLVYLSLLLVPWLGLWLRAPMLLLAAMPELALDLLSNDPNQASIVHHYSAGIAPFVVAASVVGASRLRWRPERAGLYALVATAVLGSLSPLVFAAPDPRALLRPDAAHEARREAVALVPDDAPVSATNAFAGHLSDRRRILVYPVIGDADWLVLDRADDDYLAEGGPSSARFDATARDRRFRVVYDRAGVLVLRRVGDATSR